MKTYPRDAAIDWNAVRSTAYGIHSTPTEVIIYESPDEVPVPPAPPDNPVPQEVDVIQALKALDAAGLAPAFEAWASAPERTFIERAFINRTAHWRRDDPILIAGATAIGISSAQLDELFTLAATL